MACHLGRRLHAKLARRQVKCFISCGCCVALLIGAVRPTEEEESTQRTLGSSQQQAAGLSDVDSYDRFLDKVFTASLRMMLPADKDTLGGHCFRYAALMTHEYYANGTGPEDILAFKSNDHFEEAFKSAGKGKRVKMGDFIGYVWSQRQIKEFASYAFGAYLASVFDAATALMLPEIKNDLGLHCFAYAVMMSGEFYFDGKSGEDRLGLTKPPNASDARFAHVHASVGKDWEQVRKTDGRVSRDDFKRYFLAKALVPDLFSKPTKATASVNIEVTVGLGPPSVTAPHEHVVTVPAKI